MKIKNNMKKQHNTRAGEFDSQSENRKSSWNRRDNTRNNRRYDKRNSKLKKKDKWENQSKKVTDEQDLCIILPIYKKR